MDLENSSIDVSLSGQFNINHNHDSNYISPRHHDIDLITQKKPSFDIDIQNQYQWAEQQAGKTTVSRIEYLPLYMNHTIRIQGQINNRQVPLRYRITMFKTKLMPEANNAKDFAMPRSAGAYWYMCSDNLQLRNHFSKSFHTVLQDKWVKINPPVQVNPGTQASEDRRYAFQKNVSMRYTFNTKKPIKTKIGNFEWYLLSAKLKSSGFTPPGTEKQYPENVFLYRKKINQIGRSDDWRYLQALIMTYSPSFVNGLSIGFIRTIQMYSALVEGKYTWMQGSPTYFPVFANLFRKNDQFTDYEDQTDQSAGLFFRWVMKDSKTEIYGEYNFHDAKWNLRDLLVNPEHARAYTIGLQKVFKKSNHNLVFNWEWTQLEQSPSKIVRDAGSWYRHSFVFDGYTNFGEVLGFKVGPGSNSQNLSISYIKDFKTIEAESNGLLEL